MRLDREIFVYFWKEFGRKTQKIHSKLVKNRMLKGVVINNLVY